MVELRCVAIEGCFEKSIRVDSIPKNGLNSDPTGSQNNKNLAGQLRLPFSWKVKASRSTSLLESFYHAFNGLKSAIQSERNLRIHLVAAGLAAILGLALRIDAMQWAAITLAIGVVLTAEFINTAVEHIVDLVTGRTYFEATKAAKDTSAAAVLVASICALITGSVIFLPSYSTFFTKSASSALNQHATDHCSNRSLHSARLHGLGSIGRNTLDTNHGQD